MRLKSILERNNVHACGMDVSKPICDYMANVSEHLIGGAPLKTLEAGDAEILIHMLPTALDNFLEKELKLLISMDIDDIEDPTPGCVNVLLQFLDVRSVFSNISCEFFKRFSERERHQLFLEPQTAKCTEYYINGMSSSLPIEVQKKMIHSVKGLENARIIRYGYAIEYDYVDPTELKHTLETKKIKNLYHAGQINATTGYEEAAAQGLMASINASLAIDNKEPFILRRDEAYIGVLIDDLVTKGTNEPYRMFTSRAEYRLLLREENADIRLSGYGHELGLIDDETFAKVENKRKVLEDAVEFMASTWITSKKETLELLESIGEEKINDKVLLIDLVGRNTIDIEKFDVLVPTLKELDEYLKNQIIIEAKYYRYIQKQQKQIEKMKKMLKLSIPDSFSYKNLPGLSNEVVEKLERHRPPTLYNASLISGITPAAIDIIHLNLNLVSKK